MGVVFLMVVTRLEGDLRQAGREASGLLVIGALGRNCHSGFPLGSTAGCVARHAALPVFIARVLICTA